MRRLYSLVLLILIALDVIGASGQIVKPGTVSWPVGPCALYRHANQPELLLSCHERDVAQIWPLPLFMEPQKLAQSTVP
jgi:hypothetical protein